MTSYRGVSQQAVVQSIIQACELVQKNSPGPGCDEEVDEILAAVPALQKAADDTSFRDALKESNVPTLTRMHALFETYAIDNIGGVGRQVYKDLRIWGIFNGGITLESRLMDREILPYTLLASLRRIKNVDADQLKNQFKENYNVVDEAHLEKAIANLDALVKQAQGGATDQQLLASFEEINEAHWQDGNTIRNAADFASDDPTLRKEAPSPFAMYVVVLANSEEGISRQNLREENSPLIDTIKGALNPFYETHEIQMITLGTARDGIGALDLKGPAGVLFVATHRVAQAMANAFPNQQIMRSDETVIAPDSSKPASRNNPPAL